MPHDIIFGANNSLSRYFDKHETDLLVLGEQSSDDVNDNITEINQNFA